MKKKDNVSRACYLCMRNLKELRLQRKITISQISAYLESHGFPRDEKTIYGWEYGQSEPPFEVLLLIADYLGCNDIFQLAEMKENPSPLSLSQKEKLLLAAYRRTPCMQGAVDLLLGLGSEEET